ncbi:MAG: PHB depolymerase family esterase [Chitinophagales bacterium]|nr:PHB depolymerase family esterase [Chitinophagales bacterium]
MKSHYYILLLVLLVSFNQCKKKYEKAGLQEFSNFGSNKGNLNAYFYEPENVQSNAPLLVALHGCTQNALEMSLCTGWDELADRYGFYVLYPEQKTINNATKCFNWFLEGDINKNQGEVSSINDMINKLVATKSINTSQIYITGLSAGGAMTMAMVSCYPQTFKGAIVMAGVPYKAATNIYESIPASKGEIDKTPEQWGDLVRAQNPAYSGSFPVLSVVHGTDDNVVNYQNALEIVDQWSDILNIDLQNRTSSSYNAEVRDIQYFNSANMPQIQLYEINNLGHNVALDPGTGIEQGGDDTQQYTKDKDFYSCYWAGKFIGLID